MKLSQRTANLLKTGNQFSFFSTNQRPDIRSTVVGMLDQQKRFLQSLIQTPSQSINSPYTFMCDFFGGSIGGHIRHSLDHIHRPIDAANLIGTIPVIDYDHRKRNTQVENDIEIAIQTIEELQLRVKDICEVDLGQPVTAVFMLSAEGNEIELKSTLERELAFSVHHCIHHNAIIKFISKKHFSQVKIPSDFGLAPSTANFRSY